MTRPRVANQGGPTTAAYLFMDDDIIFDSSDPINTSGGFGDLFVARHRRYGKVALKRLRDGQAAKQEQHLMREAHVWKGLSHAFILPFLGLYHFRNRFYLVAPFVENGALPGFLLRYPATDRQRLIYEIADGLAYLHDQGVVHGDIKGDNVLVSDEFHPLLCDFGLAKVVDCRTSTSQAGGGSLRWQAPELMDNASKTYKSDVYAFGLTISQILSDKVPFHQYTQTAAIYAAVFVRNERPSFQPPSSPIGQSYAHLWVVAQWCWARDSTTRPTMKDVLFSLTPPSTISAQLDAPRDLRIPVDQHESSSESYPTPQQVVYIPAESTEHMQIVFVSPGASVVEIPYVVPTQPAILRPVDGRATSKQATGGRRRVSFRGETCIAYATLFSLISFLILVIADISQCGTDVITSHLYMVQINATDFQEAFDDSISPLSGAGLFLPDYAAPSTASQGLRRIYAWGLYGHCEYIRANRTWGSCTGTAIANGFDPWNVFSSDVPSTYANQTEDLVPANSIFRSSAYTSSLSQPASVFVFLATICAGLACLTGLVRARLTFRISCYSSVAGSLFLLIGGAMWTSLISQTKQLNAATIPTGTPLGIAISSGPALSLIWAAFACLAVASFPYTISMMSYLKI